MLSPLVAGGESHRLSPEERHGHGSERPKDHYLLIRSEIWHNIENALRIASHLLIIDGWKWFWLEVKEVCPRNINLCCNEGLQKLDECGLFSGSQQVPTTNEERLVFVHFTNLRVLVSHWKLTIKRLRNHCDGTRSRSGEIWWADPSGRSFRRCFQKNLTWTEWVGFFNWGTFWTGQASP